MAMVIAHNISATNTSRNLNWNSRNLSKSLEKLSSGYRINSGSDGPADLVISEQLRAQGAGLERAVRNTSEASNVIGIAEGALNEMNAILKSMRGLALHAINNGITSPIQVAADQAEVDSSIQTLDRIANTTKYSDQFLLNGNKSLTFDRTTNVNKATDHALLDTGLSRIDQVFKTEGYSVNITFSGASDAAETTGDRTKMATKGYFEANSATSGTQIDSITGTATVATKTTISADQRFEIAGNLGARVFSFASGTHLGEMAKGINDLSDSTGVTAQLVFSASVTGTALTGAAAQTTAVTARAAAATECYTTDNTGAIVSAAGISLAAATGASVGKNTDGDGRIWVKWETGSVGIKGTAYKDQEMTMEVGSYSDTATNVKTFTAKNNSGLTGLSTTAAVAGTMVSGNVTMIQVANAFELDDTGVVEGDMANITGFNSTTYALSQVSGVRLGQNTDATGNLYFKLVAGSGANAKIEAYKDANMGADSLVATSADNIATAAAARTVRLVETKIGGDGPKSGIFASLTFSATALQIGNSGKISFDNLGLRINSSDYGSEEYVRVQQLEGSLFTDTKTGNLIESGTSGATKTSYGTNASITVNGSKLDMRGTEADISTQDMNASFIFNQGELGKTTIAVAGYNDGAIASRVGQVGSSGTGNYATHAIHNTGELLDGFEGGMQFQLGEGSGGQERTTYAIQSMTVSNMGRTRMVGDFSDTGVNEEKLLSVQDMLGGGHASLGTDAVKALKIIDQAIADVSDLRARLGAFQKNMLQTNANSLEVAIENIQKTESAIRDADMAAETTDFTRNQIMVSAATNMLAQANASQQQVLQLLG